MVAAWLCRQKIIMKTALITGANRGLGMGFVEYLLDSKYLVFAGIRNPQLFNKKIKKNPNLKLITLDVTKDISIKRAVHSVSKQVKQLDILINNAGVNKDSATNNKKNLVCDLKYLNREKLLTMFNVNSISPIIILKEFSDLLKSRPSFVINISSCRASFHDEYKNMTGNYGYRASKIALNMFTFCSIFDLPKNIKSFAVHPGNVKTDMNTDGKQLPYTQADKIIAITENWQDKFNGKFLRFDGRFYPL